MFEKLTTSLNKIFDKLTGVGYLTEEHVDDALREIRIALIEADVALPVVKEFARLVKEKAVGADITKSVAPGQMVIKIVQDCLTEILSKDSHELDLKTSAPAVVLMVGLQGSGKTTSTGKLANKLKKQGKRILLASIDINRPAAQEQLATLARKLEVDFFELPSKKPKVIEVTREIMKQAQQYDVLLLDTAGRLHVDDKLMKELKQVQKLTAPIETLLVVDALTGQDAVNIAQTFKDNIKITGIIITRMDSDTRGGAALSISHVTDCPIKFLGVGENIENLDQFHPDRMASRILDMGDVVSLVEQAQESFDEDKTESMMKDLQEGRFDLNTLAEQMKGVKKMGGLGSVMKMIPGISKMMKSAQAANMDEGVIDRQLAIISSMTRDEKSNPMIFNASRKKRVAAGSGVQVQDVNKLLKQYLQANKAFKRLRKMDKNKLNPSSISDLFS